MHHVLGLRVGQVGELRCCLQAVRWAVPDLCPLGVLGTRWDAPFQRDAEDDRGGRQVCDLRRQPFLALQLSERRVTPDRRYVERADGSNPGQVGASIDAHHIDRGGTDALQADPVTVVLAPFHIVSNRPLDRRPADGHGADRDPLIHGVGRGQRNAGRRRYGSDRNDADRALVQLGAGVDCCELARVELERSDLVLAFLGASGLQHAEQLHRQVFVVDCPLQLGLWLHAVFSRHRHRAAGHRLHRARLSGAVGQVQDQAVTCLDRRVAIEGDHSAGSGGDPSTIRAAGHQLIRHRDDIARQRDTAFHAGLEADSAVLAVAQQCPLPPALGFGGARAADGRDLDWPVAVPALQRQVGHRDHIGVVVVGRVVVADQRTAVVGVSLGTAVHELTVDDVGPCEHIVDVLRARHVSLHEQRAVGPVHHATVDGRQVAQ
ncbi:hypothetical protein D3C81_532430 [compost metagenome]